LNIANTDDVDYHKVADDFMRDKLSLRKDDDDIEMAHPLPTRTSSPDARSATSAGRRKEVALVIHICSCVIRGKVISRCRNLKGTNQAIAET
jgi:hypothetical protein